MARKSKKAKSRKKAQRRREVNSNAADVKALKDAVAECRGRRAMAILKKLKGDVDPRLAAETYMLRILELWEDWHVDEAREMYACHFQPGSPYFDHLTSEDKLLMSVYFAPAEFWTNPAAYDVEEAALQEILQCELNDPRVLSANDGIPPDHPVKQDAGNLLAAWRAVDEGNFQVARQLLGKIGRRSVMKNWRLFVQALIAYHEMDDSGVEAALSRISSSSPVALLADDLRSLSSGECIAIDEKGKELYETARKSNPRNARKSVRRLAEYFVGKNESILVAELISRIPQFDGSNFLNSGQLAGLLLARRAFRQREFAYDSLELAEDAAHALMNSGISDLEHALILDYVLDRWINAFDCEFTRIIVDRHVPITWAPHKYVIDDLDADEMFGIIYDLAEQALSAKPLPQTFERLAAFAEEFDLQSFLQPLLARWGESVSGDAAALRNALGYYRKSKAFDLASAAYEQLKALEGGGGNDALGITIRLETAASKLAGEPGEAAKVKDLVVAEHWQEILRDLIVWMAADNRREKAAAGKVLAKHERPVMIEEFACLIDSNFKHSSLPQRILKQTKELGAMSRLVAGIEEQAAIGDEIWGISLNHLSENILKHLSHSRTCEQRLEVIKFYLRHTDAKNLADNALSATSVFMHFAGKDDPNSWLARAACYAGFVLNANTYARGEVDQRIRTIVRIAAEKKKKRKKRENDADLVAFLEAHGYAITTDGKCPSMRVQTDLFDSEKYLSRFDALYEIFTPKHGRSSFDSLPFNPFDDDVFDDFDEELEDRFDEMLDNLNADQLDEIEKIFETFEQGFNSAFEWQPAGGTKKKKGKEVATPALDRLDPAVKAHIEKKSLSPAELVILDREFGKLNIHSVRDVPGRILSYAMSRSKRVNIQSEVEVMKMVIDYVEDTFLKKTRHGGN